VNDDYAQRINRKDFQGKVCAELLTGGLPRGSLRGKAFFYRVFRLPQRGLWNPMPIRPKLRKIRFLEYATSEQGHDVITKFRSSKVKNKPTEGGTSDYLHVAGTDNDAYLLILTERASSMWCIFATG